MEFLTAEVSDDDPALHWFEALFAANHDDLLRYAARRVGPHSAPDVVAEVFLAAWRRRMEFDRDGARLWLFGVARRLVANEQRSQLRRARLTNRIGSENADEPDVADHVIDSDLVRQALAALGSLEQEALRLTEWDRFSITEAAAIAGCTNATFRVRLHRARRQLAKTLTEDVTL